MRRQLPRAANYNPNDPLRSRFLKCVASIYDVIFDF